MITELDRTGTVDALARLLDDSLELYDETSVVGALG